MTQSSIQQFSTAAASNTNIDGINVSVGWPPGNVGQAFRELMALLASSLVPLSLDVAGESAVTLTAAQASAQAIQCTGALTANCTVTLPNALFVGWINNATTGGFDIILTAGVGTTVMIPPATTWYYYQCDGATNVTLPTLNPPNGWQEIATYSPSGVSMQGFALPTTFRRFRITLQGMMVTTTGGLFFFRFSSDGGSSQIVSNYNFAFTGVYNTGATLAGGGDPSNTIGGIQLSPSIPTTSSWDGTYEIYPGSASFLPAVRGNGYGYDVDDLYLLLTIGGSWNEGSPEAMNYGYVLTTEGYLSGTIILEGLP